MPAVVGEILGRRHVGAAVGSIRDDGFQFRERIPARELLLMCICIVILRILMLVMLKMRECRYKEHSSLLWTTDW